MSEEKGPSRRYTDEFREEAARLANSVGQLEAARRLGVPIATIGNWARRSRKGEVLAAPLAVTPAPQTRPKVTVSEPEAEITRLRKELFSAKLDLELLRKATAYFARVSR